MFIREFNAGIILLMINENCLKLWDSNEQQQEAILYRPHNRLRKSLDNARKLREDLFRLRTSLSNTSLAKIDFASPLKKNNSTSILHAKRMDTAQKTAKTNIKTKLELIEKKLKDAKRTIEPEQQHSDIKTTLDTMQSLEEIASSDTKESIRESQHIRQKSRLSNYTTNMPKPENIRPISHNPYTIKSKYYLSQLVRVINERKSLAMDHIGQSIQMLLQYRLCKLNQEQLFEDDAKICLPLAEHNKNKKTLILDLDETLIHCFESGQADPDLKLTINIDGYPFEIGINIRPYAISFLKRMKKRWEIVVFTASHQSYADTILNELDPQGILVDHRLYRQHCRQLTTDLFIKDLSKINRDLSKMVLVDNSAYSYAMQIDNGIPIIPFYEGKDFELSALEHYLNKLSECQDVREMNREYFQLHKYTSYDNSANLVRELYCSKVQ